MEDLLKETKLGQYLEALQDAGYEDLDSLEGVTKHDLVADVAGMLPGHANKLVRALEKKSAEKTTKGDDVALPPLLGDSSKISKQRSDSIEAEMVFELIGGNMADADEKKSDETIAVCKERFGMPLPKKGINVVESVGSWKETKSLKENKTILIVGQTGCGKTTLINSMMNYLYGVKSDDPFRYSLIEENFGKSQAQSQTSDVTGYYIEPPKLEYGLTIIDTPGFGDTRGLKYDEEIAKKIKEFFENEVTGLNAVCFVMNASVPRLTAPQKYIFQRLMGIFGKEIETHILGLFTFCDGADEINALAAVKAEGIPLREYFRINNSAFGEKALNKLSAENKGDDESGHNFVKMFWLLGVGAYLQFFKTLNGMGYVSLDSTREVLRQRDQLQIQIDSFQRLIQSGIRELETLRQYISQVQDLEGKIDGNKDYTMVSTVEEEYKEPITDGSYTTLCNICRKTCHKSCAIPNDSDKRLCGAMSGDNCTVCPERCHWSNHQNNKYRWEMRTVEKTTTLHALKAAYTDATDKRSSAVQMLDNLGKQFIHTQECVYKLIGEVHKCVQNLQKIALRPNVLNQTQYIQTLIMSEEAEQKPGFMDRIGQYKRLLKDSERLEEIMTGDYNPFEEHADAISQMKQNSNKKNSGFWSYVPVPKMFKK